MYLDTFFVLRQRPIDTNNRSDWSYFVCTSYILLLYTIYSLSSRARRLFKRVYAYNNSTNRRFTNYTYTSVKCL